MSDKISKFERLEIIDEQIEDWERKIKDLEFSIEQLQDYKKELKYGSISKKEVEDALNECFQHTMSYGGFIQIFPNATYTVDGKDVQKLYKRLGLKNKVD